MSDPFAYNFEDAFYGPLGEYAHRNEERVEIDSLSLLLQLLTVVSVAIGPRAHTMGGTTRHYPNLFSLIVGTTTIGKGGSGEVANELGAAIDPGFEKRTAYNVASAPALVQLVTDGRKVTKKGTRKGVAYENVEVVHEPVVDKRLLLFFPEMRATLVHQGRRGSTLKDELKNVWDGRTIENNTRDCYERATTPHIGLIGHITPVDLTELATRADVGNGYFNRYLITVAKRERSLPFTVESPDCRDLLSQIANALNALGPVNQHEKRLDWADDARDEWEAFYDAVRQGRHPFIADILEIGGRVCPLTKRVALIYAILDGASAIHLRHLRAAKAVVLEALNRSRHLFAGRKKLSTLPDELRNAFAHCEGEWTKTTMHEKTGKRHKANDLEAAAAALVEAGEWLVREGQTGNGHDSKFWSLASIEAGPPENEEPSPGFEDPLPDAEELRPEIEERLPDGMVEVEGIRLQCGAPVIVAHHATALTFSGHPTGVKLDQPGHLAAIAAETPPDQRNAVHERITKHPIHSCVIFGNEVLFVPKKAVKLVEHAAVPA
jgi:hypothetical protein